jgi:hypothetical protein
MKKKGKWDREREEAEGEVREKKGSNRSRMYIVIDHARRKERLRSRRLTKAAKWSHPTNQEEIRRSFGGARRRLYSMSPPLTYGNPEAISASESAMVEVIRHTKMNPKSMTTGPPAVRVVCASGTIPVMTEVTVTVVARVCNGATARLIL